MASRGQNERKFKSWEDLPNGGRRYVRDFAGRAGGRARYIKEVDADEKTTRFAQEIYDAAGRLTTAHEKFPVDLGHKQM
jgi:YD repeat-containing protein